MGDTWRVLIRSDKILSYRIIFIGLAAQSKMDTAESSAANENHSSRYIQIH